MATVRLEKASCQKKTGEDFSVLLEGMERAQEHFFCCVDFLCNEVNLEVGQIKRREEQSAGICSPGLSEFLKEFQEQCGKILETGKEMSGQFQNFNVMLHKHKLL